LPGASTTMWCSPRTARFGSGAITARVRPVFWRPAPSITRPSWTTSSTSGPRPRPFTVRSGTSMWRLPPSWALTCSPEARWRA